MTLDEHVTYWSAQPAQWQASADEVAAIMAAAEDHPKGDSDRKLFKRFATTFMTRTDPQHTDRQRRLISDMLKAFGAAKVATGDPPLDKVPAILRDIVVACDRQLNASRPMGLGVTIAVLGLCVQALYDVDSGRYGKLTLAQYVLGSQPASGGKTTLYKRLKVGIDKLGAEDAPKHAVEHKAYTAFRKRYDDQIKKLAAEEAMTQADLTAAIGQLEKPKPPLTYQRVLLKFTTNGLIRLLKDGPSVGVFESDAGAVLDSYSLNNQAVEFVATLTALWDGSPIGKATGLEDVYLAGRRASILLLAQPGIFNNFTSDPQFRDQGILNRFFLVKASERPRRKNLAPAGNPMDQHHDNGAFQRFADLTYRLLRRPMAVNESFELTPKTLGWDGEGRPDRDSPAWLSIMTAADEIIDRTPSDYADISNAAARFHEHAIKLAGTFAVIDDREVISLADAEAAVALARWQIDHRLAIEKSRQPASKVYHRALMVLTKLQSWHKASGVDKWSERDLRNSAGDLLKASETREPIWQEMTKNGWITRTQNGTYAKLPTFAIALTDDGKKQKTTH